MFAKHSLIAPDLAAEFLTAAEAAARAIPPAFPLAATVAVNPFLGQTGEGLATVIARLSRVGGLRPVPARSVQAARIASGAVTEGDIAAALADLGESLTVAEVLAAATQEAPVAQALPTVAGLAARATGTDWEAVIQRTFGLWAGAYFDRGQALWTPAPGQGAFAAWRAWAVHDLTPELAGLTGFAAHVAQAPDTAERAILRAADRLGLTPAAAGSAFHRLLVDLGGWAMHARWLLWEAELKGATDATVTDLLAIRLVWEEALLARAGADAWAAVVQAHAVPVVPSRDDRICAALQAAADRASARGFAAKIGKGDAAAPVRPALQAAFCIDVRSEVFRRALEAQDAGIETIGFAGFFGLPVAHRPMGSDVVDQHLPVLLNAGVTSASQVTPAAETEVRIAARAVRAWGRFRQAAVSSLAFVEAAGPVYAGKLVTDALGLHGAGKAAPAPVLEPALPLPARVATAKAVLGAMSMVGPFAPVVILAGHGAQVTNNPHASAYHCGACGGQTGEVSARLLASLLNDVDVREGLRAEGIDLPADTRFVGALHDTTTDVVTLYPEGLAGANAGQVAAAERWLKAAAGRARTERALRLPGSTGDTVARRAFNWAEVRPEWGLAGCAAFVAGPRAMTKGVDLGGRAFLHDYDREADARGGFGVLELILTAPVVVASWISLQYYGSSVAPELFGGGNKLIHNVVGGIGVVEGNGGVLRPGLPWQAVHDGAGLQHDPLRLAVMIAAPADAMDAVLARHPGVAALFDNGWLSLHALAEGGPVIRRKPGGGWEVFA